MKIFNTVFFSKKKVALGDGHVTQYTFFENKNFGGIWLYSWGHVGNQVRMHSHAFSSYCFTLKGSYIQDVLDENGIRRENVSNLFRPRYLPKNYVHRIVDAQPNTWTCVFFGKWSPYWFEYFEDTKTWVKYTWNRKVVDKIVDVSYNEIKDLLNL